MPLGTEIKMELTQRVDMILVYVYMNDDLLHLDPIV